MIPQQESLQPNTYLQFTAGMNEVTKAPGVPQIRVPEKTVRCVWNAQLFKSQPLQTAAGEDLEILFPGYWNFGPGPDFKSAALKVGGTLHEGDVEIHIYSGDWDALEHSHDPDYDRVILHVYLWNSPGRTPAEDRRLPRFELELKDHLAKGILELKDELDFENFPLYHQTQFGRCEKTLAGLAPEKLAALLEAAGDARIRTKMDRFHDRILLNGYEQTFYEGVAEALGYPSNKEPFRKLAEALPLHRIGELLPGRDASPERVLKLQALLFGMAGMIGFKSLDTARLDPEDADYFATLNRLWDTLRPGTEGPALDIGMWKFGGIRPANSPYRRIAGLAHLILRHEQDGMFAAWTRKVKSAFSRTPGAGYNKKIPGSLLDFFCVEASDYWSWHLSPGGKRLAKGQQLIGPARSGEISVNIALPIGLIFARASRSLELETGCNLLFQAKKSTGDNKLLRFMRHYIFGDDKERIRVVRNDRHMQGLMQIYQDFCTQNHNSCHRCRFPDLVQENFS